MVKINKEKRLSEIYHKDWKRFSRSQFDKAVSLFKGRLKANGVDVSNLIKGKICLDAGCGSGRYIQAMLDEEAKQVVGQDLNIAIAKHHIHDKRAVLLQGDIRHIDYPDNYFDFVCCNGVLHHTSQPNKILKELTRVLKVGGYLFLFVYHPKDMDWEIIDQFRAVCKKYSVERVRKFFRTHMEYDQLFDLMDYFYAPTQLRFTKKQVKNMLKGYKVKFLTNPFVRYDNYWDNRSISKKLR